MFALHNTIELMQEWNFVVMFVFSYHNHTIEEYCTSVTNHGDLNLESMCLPFKHFEPHTNILSLTQDTALLKDM